ncbi:hypothetical protein E3P92_03741 [Wallemia ichthyophaga]|nr:hypothetical protein E3P92_03741 [Wallemia ichthyophaga]
MSEMSEIKEGDVQFICVGSLDQRQSQNENPKHIHIHSHINPPQPAKKSRSRNKSKVPRPANAWILYRSESLAKIKQEQAAAKPAQCLRESQTELSKNLSARWLNETEEVREHYLAKSEQVKREHKLMYPEYQYKPRRKESGGVRSKSAARGQRPVKSGRGAQSARRKETDAHRELEELIREKQEAEVAREKEMETEMYEKNDSDNEQDTSYIGQRRGRANAQTKSRNSLRRREEASRNHEDDKKTTLHAGNTLAVDLSFDEAQVKREIDESENQLPAFTFSDTASASSHSYPHSYSQSLSSPPSFLQSEPSSSYTQCTHYAHPTHPEDMYMSAIPPYLRLEMDHYINMEEKEVSGNGSGSGWVSDSALDVSNSDANPQASSLSNLAYDPAVMLAPATAANLANEWAAIDNTCLEYGLDFTRHGYGDDLGDARMDFDFDMVLGDVDGSEGVDGSGAGGIGDIGDTYYHNDNFNYINQVFGDIPSQHTQSAPIDIPKAEAETEAQMFSYMEALPGTTQESSSHGVIVGAGLGSSCSSTSTSTFSSASSVQPYTHALPDTIDSVTNLSNGLDETHITDGTKKLINDYLYESGKSGGGGVSQLQSQSQNQSQSHHHAAPSYQDIFRAFQREL